MTEGNGGLSFSIYILAILNSENQNLLVHDYKNYPIVSHTKLAHPSEYSGEGRETLRIIGKIIVGFIKNAFCISFVDALEILGDRFFIVDVIA